MSKIPKSSFTRSFVMLNRLERSGFAHWVFKSGMEFETFDKWWDGECSRVTPHEGFDFCCFEDRNGKLVNLVAKSIVPAMYAGTVVSIFKDLLGSSILVAHDFLEKGRRLYSIYAHTSAFNTIQTGIRVKAGEAIAMICAVENKSILPHLHLSVIWAEDSAIANLDWQTMHLANGVILCNPLDFLDSGFTIKVM